MLNKVCEKIKGVGRWIKKKTKAILVGLGIVGIAYAATLQNGVLPEVPPILADGQIIEFLYTDENSNEDLIIKTDKENYSNLFSWDNVDVYVAVKNISKKHQSGDLRFFFSKNGFTINSIKKLNNLQLITTTIDEYGMVSYGCATTTGITICKNWEKIGEHKKQVYQGTWNDESLSSFTKADVLTSASVKPIPEKFREDKKTSFSIKNDGYTFYKLNIQLPDDFGTAEFYAEAISPDAYGLLDPTIFTDDFNSLGYGTINGTSSWSGGTGYKVQDTWVYEGAKALAKNQADGGGDEINKTGSQVNEGKMTFYIRDTAAVSTYNSAVYLREGTSAGLIIGMSNTGHFNYNDAGGWHDSAIDWAINTDYQVEIEWQDTGGTNPQWRWSIDDGTWQGWYEASTDWGTGLNNVQLYGSPDNAHITYFDYFAQEPYAPPVEVEEIIRGQVID